MEFPNKDTEEISKNVNKLQSKIELKQAFLISLLNFYGILFLGNSIF